MALLLLGVWGILLLLGLWGLLQGCTRSPSLAPRWPPGPRPLPFLGNLHLLGVTQQDRALMELSERYGPMFTIHLGSQKTVVLSGYEVVREALVGTGHELADRPPIPIFQHIQRGGGIFFSSGARWRAGRQFTVRTLQSLGVQQPSMVGKVLQELACLKGQLDSYGGQPLPLALLGWAPCNITFTLLFGQRFDYQDPVFVSLLSLIDQVMVLLGSPGIQEDDPEDMFGEANVLACTLDMVMAGTETTAATLQWAVFLMVKHPHVQGRVQEELDRVLGPGQLPQPEHQRALPYTSAVLHEVQRYITLLPHVPRCTAADIQLGGYLLPKGTPVIPLLTSVLLDKTQWETPSQFNPNHFLDAKGRFMKRGAFLPFSAGRRVCVGKSLARTELFLLFAGLLQRYRLLPPPGLSPADLDLRPAPAFTMRPPAQTLCVVPRS
ncbi:cytochrome P450 2W1 isoform X2 [Mus musculus]|uniref:cytochrome P450 2W1 isoform X2 n=1 Tax=Mus musculus TaxID=10090 RepID=UPI0003D75DA7|nr:cytochrome P450 2W1 isoform X2 [Mus musculus]|eukprot:XP_006504783.1 PREDICTED: cytochrome P450 2W1 isoform X2 [Mus musculus]